MVIWLLFFNFVFALKSGVDPDGPFCNSSYCSSSQTCCTNPDDSPGCCPYPNANCCGLKDQTCCPKGYLCDPIIDTCAPYANSTLCQGCQDTVRQISKYGCANVCAYIPPPANSVCLMIIQLGLCDSILNWFTANGSPTLTICSLAGFCSGGTCSCGYCTRFTYDRCLSVPNHCPGGILPVPISQPKSQSHKSLPQFQQDIGNPLKRCLNGVCTPQNEGCCLTCL